MDKTFMIDISLFIKKKIIKLNISAQLVTSKLQRLSRKKYFILQANREKNKQDSLIGQHGFTLRNKSMLLIIFM